MFHRLSIALVQVKAGNTSEKLLNETRQIIYFLVVDSGATWCTLWPQTWKLSYIFSKKCFPYILRNRTFLPHY